jgi:hypothetical protein
MSAKKRASASSGGTASVDHKKAKTSPDVRYSGYTVPRDGAPIERRAVSSLTPAQFFAEFVSARKPVVLTGAADLDPGWKGSALWTNAHLQQVAGPSVVRVERRATASDAYGRGQNVRMKFGELLRLLEAGDARHYMTTQDLEVDEEGRPALMSAPCTDLYAAGDFPLIPALLGSLLPMNYNMWLGNTLASEGGSSSGLHHDFHDNLYVLLRGRKRFRLFSPADAPALYTAGELARVHPNGRICYEGAPTNADGSDADAVAAMRAELQREAAERELEAAEAAVASDEDGAAERLEAAEEALEAAMEAGLDAELGMDDDENSDGDESAPQMWGADWKGEAEEEDSDDEPVDSQGNQDEAQTAGASEEPEPTPNNFCAVDLNQPDWRERWPLAKRAFMAEVNVEAGEMLWLPAGWFHEVTSMTTAAAAAAGHSGGDADRGADADESKCVASEAGHMAFNYWFHPPDSDSFERPYHSEFWRWDWDHRQATSSREEENESGGAVLE